MHSGGGGAGWIEIVIGTAMRERESTILCQSKLACGKRNKTDTHILVHDQLCHVSMIFVWAMIGLRIKSQRETPDGGSRGNSLI